MNAFTNNDDLYKEDTKTLFNVHVIDIIRIDHVEVSIMKLRCQLSNLMGRDKMNIQDVCRATGLSRNTVADLYYEKSVRINYETILLLCKLFNCEVGELFVIEKDTKEDEAHK